MYGEWSPAHVSQNLYRISSRNLNKMFTFLVGASSPHVTLQAGPTLGNKIFVYLDSALPLSASQRRSCRTAELPKSPTARVG